MEIENKDSVSEGILNKVIEPEIENKKKNSVLSKLILLLVLILIITFGGKFGYSYYIKYSAKQAILKEENIKKQKLIQLFSDLKSVLTPYASITGSVILDKGDFDGLKVYMPSLGIKGWNFTKFVDIKLASIKNDKGSEILDKNSSFEKDTFFTSVSLKDVHDPVLHMEGTRSVNKTDDNSSVATVSGNLSLNIPNNIKTVSFTREQMLKNPNPQDVISVSISSVDDIMNSYLNSFNLVTSGDLRDIVAVAAYDAKDRDFPISSVSQLDNGYFVSIDNQFVAISKVVVYYTSDFDKQSYPFSLVFKKDASVQNQNVSVSLPQDISVPAVKPSISLEKSLPISANDKDITIKKAIITGLIKNYNDLKSKDVEKVRAVLLVLAPTAKDKEEIKNARTEDVFGAAGVFVSFMTPPSLSWVTDPNITWNIKANSANVKIKDKDGQSSFTAQLIDGVWYY